MATELPNLLAWVNTSDTTTETWTELASPFIDGESTRSAYIYRACVDGLGRLHIVFNWRETSATSTAHDVCYAMLSGGSWYQDPNAAVAQTVPITLLNAKVIVAIPVLSGLHERAGLTVDPTNNRPILCTAWANAPTGVPGYDTHYQPGDGHLDRALYRQRSEHAPTDNGETDPKELGVLELTEVPPDVAGNFAFWDADDANESGGNLTTWPDKTGVHVLVPDAAQTCAVNASDADYNKASVGTVSATGQALVTNAAFDLSDVDTITVYVRGRTGANASTKTLVEHDTTASGAGNNGWALFASSTENWNCQHQKDTSRSRHQLTGSDSTTVSLITMVFKRSLTSAEAQLTVDATPGNDRVNDDDTSGNFKSALLHVFARAGITLESLGSIRYIRLFKGELTAAQDAIVKARLANN